MSLIAKDAVALGLVVTMILGPMAAGAWTAPDTSAAPAAQPVPSGAQPQQGTQPAPGARTN